MKYGGSSFDRRASALWIDTKRQHRKNVVLIWLAVLVVVAVSLSLKRIGITKTQNIRTLDCPETQSVVAHHHTQECYDAEGKLVCPLPEREVHVHDSSCYDEAGELICGKEECTIEHEHTDACFKAVDASDIETQPSQTPRTFEADLETTSEQGEKRVAMSVRATIPAQALPAESSLKIERIGADALESEASAKKLEALEAAATKTALERMGDDASVTVLDSARLSFLDEDEKPLDPSEKVSLRLTCDAVRDTDATQLQLVHIDEKTGKAELVSQVSKVNSDEQDSSTGSEDTLAFDADKLGYFVLLKAIPGESYEEQLATMPAQTLEGKTDEAALLVYAPEGALPEGATIDLKPVDGDAATRLVTDAAARDGKSINVNSVVGVDLSFLAPDGSKVEPLAAVSVRMSTKVVPDTDSTLLAHRDGESQAELLDASSPNDSDLNLASAEIADTNEASVSFSASASGPYALAEIETLTGGVICADGEAYRVTVTYDETARIPNGAELKVREISRSAQTYLGYVSAAEDALGLDEGASTYVRLLDISITHDGQEIEPAEGSSLAVRVELDDAQADDYKVVHFADGSKEGEVISGAATEDVPEGRAIDFTTTSFSTYALISDTPGAGEDLDGRTFALINTYPNPDRALSSEPRNGYATTRLAETQTYFNLNNAKTINENDVLHLWTFEAAYDNQGQRIEGKYYIHPDGDMSRYLNITGNNGNGAVTVSQNAQALNVNYDANRNGMVRLTNDNNLAINLYGGGNQGFGPWSDGNNNEWFHLYTVEEIPGKLFHSTLTSVQRLETGELYLVYQTVYNPVSEKYESYAINGAGELVRVYEKGEEISGRSSVSPFWSFTEYKNDQGLINNYYDFKNAQADPFNANEVTNNYLMPMANGGVVSETLTGVTLDGRRENLRDSTIEAWDGASMSYFGYHIEFDENGIASLVPGTGATGSTSWLFAKYKPDDTTATLHEVETVDSVAMGVTIKLWDFPSENYITGIIGGNTYREGNYYNNSGLASLVLDDNGFPTFVVNNQTHSAFEMFDNGNNYLGEANNLFIKNLYDQTDFLEYSCFNNFASYDQQNQRFKVYDELGVPASDNSKWHWRGNFYPLNDLNPNGISGNRNWIDNNGDNLDPDDTKNGLPLHTFTEGANNQFGMTVEYGFMMPEDGMYNNQQVIYKFYGDDGNFAYIDGVKVLDIGGNHDALTGEINFSTGEVSYGPNAYLPVAEGGPRSPLARTIVEAFWMAHKFPDGTDWTDWNDPKVSKFFVMPADSTEDYPKGTFKDFTSHTFKMIYLEHGGFASNLEMRFNLPVIIPGNVAVEKRLGADSQQQYGSREFQYQLYVKPTGAQDYQLIEGYGPTQILHDADAVEKNGDRSKLTFEDGIFKLKPGQHADLVLASADYEYIVREVNIDSDVNAVIVDDNKTDRPASSSWSGTSVASAEGNTPRLVSRVLFENDLDTCDVTISKELLHGTAIAGDQMQYRLWMECQDGVLRPANKTPYTVWRLDDNDEWVPDPQYVDPETGQPKTLHSGPNGTFLIEVDQLVKIEGISSGTKYVVVEDVNPDDYRFESLDGSNDFDGSVWDEFIANRDQNYWDSYGRPDLEPADRHATGRVVYPATDIVGVNSNGMTFTLRNADYLLYDNQPDSTPGKYLEGSHFKIERQVPRGDGGYEYVPIDGYEDITVPLEGTPISLNEGIFRVTQLQSPDSYVFMYPNEVFFKVDIDSITGNHMTLVTEDGSAPGADTYEESARRRVDGSGTDEVEVLILLNQKTAELPHAGGDGVHVFRLTGSLTCLVGAVAYALIHRRQPC